MSRDRKQELAARYPGWQTLTYPYLSQVPAEMEWLARAVKQLDGRPHHVATLGNGNKLILVPNTKAKGK